LVNTIIILNLTQILRKLQYSCIICVKFSCKEESVNRFGELLLIARKRAKLSQLALAKKVDVDDSYISRMERGVFTPPSREVAVRLADALGISDKKERFAFLLEAGVARREDAQGLNLVEEGTQEAASSGTVLRSPLAPSDREILLHRLAVMEKRLEAAEKMLEAATKNLQDAHEEHRELATLAMEIFSHEVNHGSV
jgi:transcriptional regulator with XRE-family HTH domain